MNYEMFAKFVQADNGSSVQKRPLTLELERNFLPCNFVILCHYGFRDFKNYVWLSIKDKENNTNNKSGKVSLPLDVYSGERLGKTKKTSHQPASKLGIHSPWSKVMSGNGLST